MRPVGFPRSHRGGVDCADDGARLEVHELEAGGLVDEDGVRCPLVFEDVHASWVDELPVVGARLADYACCVEGCGGLEPLAITSAQHAGDRAEEGEDGMSCVGTDHV